MMALYMYLAFSYIFVITFVAKSNYESKVIKFNTIAMPAILALHIQK